MAKIKIRYQNKTTSTIESLRVFLAPVPFMQASSIQRKWADSHKTHEHSRMHETFMYRGR